MNKAILITALRESLNLSFAEAGEITGLSHRTVRYWEEGRSQPPEKAVQALTALNELVDDHVARTVAVWPHDDARTELEVFPDKHQLNRRCPFPFPSVQRAYAERVWRQLTHAGIDVPLVLGSSRQKRINQSRPLSLARLLAEKEPELFRMDGASRLIEKRGHLIVIECLQHAKVPFPAPWPDGSERLTGRYWWLMNDQSALAIQSGRYLPRLQRVGSRVVRDFYQRQPDAPKPKHLDTGGL